VLEGQLLGIAVVVVPVPGMINHVEPDLVASASFPGDVATDSTTVVRLRRLNSVN
jgi:hypothetical protein